MKVGVSLKSYNDAGSGRAGAQLMIERAAAAEAARLDSLFVGDHHCAGPYYQNSPILGRLLAEWGDNPAGALYLLPLWNPVLVAEQVATLAAIARGRFIMQCALGGGPQYGTYQFEAMGANPKTGPSALEQAIDAIRRLLAGEEVSGDGPFHFSGARIGPPLDDEVEVWIGAGAPKSIDRAARLGDAWLAGPSLTPSEAEAQMRWYRESCDEHGRTPTATPLRRDVLVAASDAEAHDAARPYVENGYRGFDESALVIGSPATVADAFRSYESLGYDTILIRHITDDQPVILRSFELLGEVRERVA